MKIKIITTDKGALKWIPKKMKACIGALNQAKHANFTYGLEYLKFSPEVVDGRITNDQMNALYDPEYQFICLHMSRAQARRWGIKDGLRGVYQRDSDLVAELWLNADENNVVRYPKKKVDRFIKVFLHEMSHALSHGTGVKDRTHFYDYELHDIAKIFPTYDVSPLVKKNILELLKKKLQILLQYLKIQKPLPKHWDLVTQPYLYPNKRYKQTGVHIGTDFAAPYGTPILAPRDGEITRTGYSQDLGCWCEYKFRDLYLICLHLSSETAKGSCKKGEILGRVGDTGDISGVHAHLEVWNRPRKVSLLKSRAEVVKYTKDPLKVFK